MAETVLITGASAGFGKAMTETFLFILVTVLSEQPDA